MSKTLSISTLFVLITRIYSDTINYSIFNFDDAFFFNIITLYTLVCNSPMQCWNLNFSLSHEVLLESLSVTAICFPFYRWALHQ